MKCKNCKTVFKPNYFNRKFCFEDECNDLEFQRLVKATISKSKKETTKKKKEVQTVQELMKIAQKVFNTWVRNRDKDKPCVSCLNPNPKKKNAGHFVASGKSKFLTFNEDNVHLQCEYCNTFLHGNLIDYRINLIDRIGLERVEWLEENRHEVRKYNREELREIIGKYK